MKGSKDTSNYVEIYRGVDRQERAKAGVRETV